MALQPYFERSSLFIFRGRAGRKKRREASVCERNIHRFPPAQSPVGDKACNPDTCPNRESNPKCFALLNDAQPTELH